MRWQAAGRFPELPTSRPVSRCRSATPMVTAQVFGAAINMLTWWPGPSSRAAPAPTARPWEGESAGLTPRPLHKRPHTPSAMPPVTSPISALPVTSTRIWESKKWFNLTEKFRLQFTAQMFNAFNHTNFDSPDLNLGDSTMGQISNTQGARQVQLALRLTR